MDSTITFTNIFFKTLASFQPLLLGVVLLWAGIWKIFAPDAKEIASRSALSLLFQHKKIAQIVYRSVGFTEVGIGILLLLPPHYRWEIAVAAGLMAAFLIYLLVAAKLAPDKTCGCFGKETTISGRTVARTGLLLAFTLIGWQAQHFWMESIAASPWYAGLLLLEILIIICLSPEIEWSRIKSFTSTSPQSQIYSDCATAAVPLSTSLQELKESKSFQNLSNFLESELSEYWREGCWRFLCFEADYQNRKATAVFAVPILEPFNRIRGVIVDEQDNTVLLTEGSSTISESDALLTRS